MKSQKKTLRIFSWILFIIFILLSGYLAYRHYHTDRGDTYFYMFLDSKKRVHARKTIRHYRKALRVFPWDSRVRRNIGTVVESVESSRIKNRYKEE